MNSISRSTSDEKVDETKLEGGEALSSTLTYGDHSPADGSDGPSTLADEKRTKAIMRRVDLKLLPICSLLYLFSFLDRTAIGNAKVANMNKELGLTDTEYALALSLFFIPYCVFEIPSNLMLKKFGAKNWLPVIVVFWGLTMTFTGFVKNAAGLIAMRLVLGGFEAGLFPGITALLTFIYPRHYIQLRIGIFFSAATIAGAFGGLLAYGLARVQVDGYNGWRWIFFVEGALTVAVAALAYWLLISSIDEAKFLSGEDRKYMSDRLKYDGQDVVPMNNEYKREFVYAGLKDWKTWITLVAYVGSLCPVYSVALTLPTILRVSLGYDPIRAQLMTVPVYCVAALTVIIFAWGSDKLQCRSLFTCLGCGLSAIGWGIGLASHEPQTRYAGCFIAAMGAYAGFPSIVALLSQNVGGATKRATSVAIQVGVGGLAGTISSNLFPAKDAPHFTRAYQVNVGLNCVAIAGTLVNVACLYYANKRKRAMIESGEAARIPKQQLADMGDASPFFAYKY